MADNDLARVPELATATQEAHAEIKQESDTIGKKARRWLRETLAALFWLYLLVKVFFVDIDAWIIASYAPSLGWLVQYRVFVFLVIACLILVFGRRWHALGWFAYILFYPVVVVFWHGGHLLFVLRSWTLALAIGGATFSFFRNIRVTVPFLTCLAIGTLVAFSAHRPAFLAVGAFALILALVIAYVRTVYRAFRSPFDAITEATLNGAWKLTDQSVQLDEDVRSMQPEEMTDKQREAWVSKLSLAVLFNQTCYWAASKLRDLRRSRLLMVTYAFRVVALFAVSAWVHSLLAMLLYRYRPAAYATQRAVYNFDFFWYGFSAMFGQQVGELHPVSVLARVLFMAAATTWLLLAGVVVMFIYSTVLASRDEQMDAVVEQMSNQAKTLETYLADQFSMTLLEAIRVMQRQQSGFLVAVYWMSPDLKPDEQQRHHHEDNAKTAESS